MTIEEKQAALNQLRETFSTFISNVVAIQCSQLQKNQAILRFDEGHMWMQNAIMTYQTPEGQTVEIKEIKEPEVNEGL